ncbi:MAG: CbiQ family ECF transporter T component [Anaeromyxobacteraceae bacterium]
MTGDPRLRLAVALLAIAVAASAPRPAGALAIAALALAAALWRGARPRVVCLLATPALLGVVAAAFGGGAVRGLAISSRVLAGGCVAAWLGTALPFRGLLAALAWARCPRAVVELLALAERQVADLGLAVAGVREAQRARLGYGGLCRGVRSGGVLAGAVTGRAFDRAVATAECLAIRGEPGFDALPPVRWGGAPDAALAGVAAIALAGCAAAGWGTW